MSSLWAIIFGLYLILMCIGIIAVILGVITAVWSDSHLRKKMNEDKKRK